MTQARAVLEQLMRLSYEDRKKIFLTLHQEMGQDPDVVSALQNLAGDAKTREIFQFHSDQIELKDDD